MEDRAAKSTRAHIGLVFLECVLVAADAFCADCGDTSSSASPYLLKRSSSSLSSPLSSTLSSTVPTGPPRWSTRCSTRSVLPRGVGRFLDPNSCSLLPSPLDGPTPACYSVPGRGLPVHATRPRATSRSSVIHLPGQRRCAPASLRASSGREESQ